jgi:hypothetical protein
MLADKMTFIALYLHVGHNSVYVPILSYAAESWATTSKTENRITAAEMKILRSSLGNTRDRCRNATVREQLIQDSLIDGIERRKPRWYGQLVRMAEDRKPRQILEARIKGKRGRGRPRKVWMDDIKEAVGRRGKTIQEVRSMATTRQNFIRWTEDPTLKGKRERRRRSWTRLERHTA